VTSAEWAMVIAAVIAAVVAIGCAAYITGAITNPINEAVRVAQTVASGDLTSRIEVQTTETGQLLGALKGMNDSLIRIVGQVRNGTDTIATASQEIATGNLDLSQRTEEQASSLEETASSMEELTSTVRQNADNARQANTLAESASAWRSAAAMWWRAWWKPWIRSTPPRTRLWTLFRSSTALRSRPISWRSMRRWKRRAPANRAAALRWWQARCGRWRSARPQRPRRSRS
jgi:HAMP domain-containing protein